MSSAARDRLLYLTISVACALVLAIAAGLEPSPQGHGTHEAMGLPPCPLLSLTGIPCPVCGMTTAFAHAVRGNVWDAFVAQPFGLLAFLMTLATAGICIGLATRVIDVRPLVRALGSSGLIVSLAGLWLVSWIYKIVTIVGR